VASKPIVVGVDDSPESRRALAVAWTIAEAARAQLIPVHAVADLWLAGGFDEMPMLLPEVQTALTQASRTLIARVIEEVLPHASLRRLEVRTGPPGFAIAEVAAERRAELVVLGGKHHSAVARGLGRSTAHYLVRKLDVPVLIVSPETETIERVLVAVDLSTAAVRTIQAAERLARLLGARLRILHVVEPLRRLYLPLEALDQAGYEAHSRELFDRMTGELAPLVREDQVVRTGVAAEAIAEEAAAWHAGLVVVGSHGKGWVDRLLVGSTTERLLHVLPTSLVVVPAGAVAKRRTAPRARRPRRRKARVARRRDD
jgi:nucleotide-binding universal stress UspA family protein